MNYVLLLGAGFSRNWGGWLASEAFEYLLGHPAIRDNMAVRPLLWKYCSSGGFESALTDVQDAYLRDPVVSKANLESFKVPYRRCLRK